MRLDLFLKSSRLILRRTLAKEFCQKGLVKVNGKTAKSSYSVQSEDEIEIRRHPRITTVKVLKVPAKKQVSKKDAGDLYEIISDEVIEEEPPFEISLIPNS
jgi:ribosomal 50S subunit-recycling heat shock protein